MTKRGKQGIKRFCKHLLQHSILKSKHDTFEYRRVTNRESRKSAIPFRSLESINILIRFLSYMIIVGTESIIVCCYLYLVNQV